MKIQGIYKIRNCINGKVYIGQSVNIEHRWRTHKDFLKSGLKYPLYHSFIKYGLGNFEFSIIEMVTDSLKLDEREQYWMDYYKSYDRNFGYNLCKEAATTKGRKHSEETKRKISIKNKGRKCTEETKRKIGLANTGQKRNIEAKTRISLALKSSKTNKDRIPWNKGKKGVQKAWNKGISCREETKIKLAKINKNYKPSEETRSKLKTVWKGRKHNDVTKQKMRESAKLIWQNRKIKEQLPNILLLPKEIILVNNINKDVVNI